MLKKIFIVFTCLFLVLSPVKATASYYQDKDPFKDVFLSFSYSKLYDFDYYFLVAQPLSYTDTDHYYLSLYLISDLSESKGAFKFCTTDQYPYNTLLYTNYTLGSFSFKYSGEVFSSYALSSESSFPLGFYNRGSSLGNGVNGWCFDNYNLDKFPTYQGTSSNYTSKFILASNVDVYNQNGDLLQYGNYYTLLQFFGGNLDASKIKDWSGHETAPGVVVEPTTSGGASGDSQTNKDQLETSKGIWGTVKDVFNKLVEIAGNIISLPFDIAIALGQILTDAFISLKNDILDGIKSLFYPSDNLFNDMRDLLESKFKFVNQIIDLVIDFSTVVWVEEPPDSNITLYGVTVSFMNWELYDDYKKLINTITIIVSYYWFVKRLIRKTPKVIGGIN